MFETLGSQFWPKLHFHVNFGGERLWQQFCESDFVCGVLARTNRKGIPILNLIIFGQMANET